MSSEIRDLIRQLSHTNPLWGAPRIHGALLKLGIEVSQAPVGRYMPWRPKLPSPTWRSFLHNHLTDIAAIDMFVVATATFRILYALIVLGHDRRKVIHFDVTHNPTQVWLRAKRPRPFRGTSRSPEQYCCYKFVAVGTAIARRPPHRSQRAALPHWAPTSGHDAKPHIREWMSQARGRQPAIDQALHSPPWHPAIPAPQPKHAMPVPYDMIVE